MQHLYVHKGKGWSDVKLSMFEVVFVLCDLGKGSVPVCKKKICTLLIFEPQDIQLVTVIVVSSLKFEVFMVVIL
jgi:hypothetical protein